MVFKTQFNCNNNQAWTIKSLSYSFELILTLNKFCFRYLRVNFEITNQEILPMSIALF